MTDKHVELANRWLERSNNDIITARQTLLLMNGPTNTPCFHAQQAIEKALLRSFNALYAVDRYEELCKKE